MVHEDVEEPLPAPPVDGLGQLPELLLGGGAAVQDPPVLFPNRRCRPAAHGWLPWVPGPLKKKNELEAMTRDWMRTTDV